MKWKKADDVCGNNDVKKKNRELTLATKRNGKNYANLRIAEKCYTLRNNRMWSNTNNEIFV